MDLLTEIASWSFDIATFAVVPVVLLALWRLPTANREQRLIVWFILFSAVCEMTAYYFGSVLHTYNLWVAHLVTLVRFPLLAWLYRDYYPRRLLLGLIAGFAALALIDSLFWEHPLEGYNAIGRSVESLLLLFLALGFLYQVMRRLNIPRLETEPLFWASCSLIIFFSGSFVIYLFNNFLLNNSEHYRLFSGLYALFLIVHYLLLAVALWVHPEADPLDQPRNTS